MESDAKLTHMQLNVQLVCRLKRHMNNLTHLYVLLQLVNDIEDMKEPRKRKSDSALPYHLKRKRTEWSQFVRGLGSEQFYQHHRVSEQLFDKIHKAIEPYIQTDPRFVRKSCCRGEFD